MADHRNRIVLAALALFWNRSHARVVRTADRTDTPGIDTIIRDTHYDQFGGALERYSAQTGPTISAHGTGSSRQAPPAWRETLRLATKTAAVTGLLATVGIGTLIGLVPNAQSATTTIVPGWGKPPDAPRTTATLPTGQLVPGRSVEAPTTRPNTAATSTIAAASTNAPDSLSAATGATLGTSLEMAGVVSSTEATPSITGDYPSFGNPGFGIPIDASNAGAAANTFPTGIPITGIPTVIPAGSPGFSLLAAAASATANAGTAASPASASSSPSVTASATSPALNGTGVASGGPSITASAPASGAANTGSGNTPASVNSDAPGAIPATSPSLSPGTSTPALVTGPSAPSIANSQPGAAPSNTAPSTGPADPNLANLNLPTTTASALSQPVDVPEPASILLLAAASAATLLRRRR